MSETITCKGLTKAYGNHVGIDELNLTVSAGEIVGFLGTNGAGKTTTLRCMTGLLRPSSGEVRLLGLDPHSNHNELMARIGYLPGELRLYEDLTGAEHLDFLGVLQRKSTPKRNEMCERIGLSQKDLNRPIRDYSRGMKQKIGLVQALQHDPEVVLLDEPTEGLDPVVQEAFFDILASLRKAGRTIFLSSHVLSEVQRTCDRVAIVKGGRLVTVDTVDALRNARSRRIKITYADDSTQELSVEPDKVVETLREVLKGDVKDITAEEAGLDEAVLALYTDKAEQ